MKRQLSRVSQCVVRLDPYSVGFVVVALAALVIDFLIAPSSFPISSRDNGALPVWIMFHNMQDLLLFRSMLLTVHTGMGTLLVGLVFFVTQQESSYRVSMAKGMYIKESRIKLTSIGFMVLFLVLLVPRLNSTNLLFVATKVAVLPYVAFAGILLVGLLKVISIASSDTHRNHLEHKYILARYRALAHAAFQVRGQKENQFLVHPLEQLQDEALRSIRAGNMAQFTLYRRTMIDIPNEYREVVDRQGKRAYDYTARTAKQWEGLRWHKKLIYEICREGIRTDNSDIAHAAVATPLEIVWGAIRRQDYETYKDYVRLLYHPLTLVYQLKDSDTKSMLSEIVVMWLRETGQFQLMSRLERSNDKDAKHYAKYFPPLFLTFQDVLKFCFNTEWYAEFKFVLKSFMNILRYEAHQSIAFPEFWPGMNYGKQSLDRSVLGYAARFQYSVLFGMAAWILKTAREKARPDAIEHQFLQDIMEQFAGFRLNEWTSLFLQLQAFDVGQKMGWDLWDLRDSTAGDMEATWIGTTHYMKSLYVWAVLAGHIKGRDISVEAFTITQQEQLKYFGFDDLLSTIDSTEFDPYLWNVSEKIVNERQRTLRDAVESLKRGVEEERAREVAKSPLDQDRVNNFKKQILQGYFRMQGLVDWFTEMKGVVDSTVTLGRELAMGIIINKDGFISDSNVVMDLVASRIGENLKLGQNDTIAQAYQRHLHHVTLVGFDRALKTMKSPIVFVSTHRLHEISTDLNTSFQYHATYDEGRWLTWEETPLYTGYLTFDEKRVPVFRVSYSTGKPHYILLDLDSVGKVELMHSTYRDSGVHGISISVEEDIRKLSTKTPIPEDQIDRKVGIQIRQPFKFVEPTADPNGVFLNVEEDDDQTKNRESMDVYERNERES